MPATTNQIWKRLKDVCPNIQFEVTWSEDPHFEWDGDGPDPADRGYQPYDVDVYARAIIRGDLVEGRDSLGGVYEKPGAYDRDVNGYLPQMLLRAVDDLAPHVAGTDMATQVQEARKLLKRALEIRYEEDMQPDRKQDWSTRRKKKRKL